MALINCPECKKEVSDQASKCIHCGFPIAQKGGVGVVRIKLPRNTATGFAALLSSKEASVIDNKNRKTLWSGTLGENAKFEIDYPTEVTIELGSFANDVVGIVEPRCKYSLVQDMGIHWNATYILTEVDVIDSD